MERIAKAEAAFWKKIFSGPLSLDQIFIMDTYPDIMEFAKKSEFQFFFNCTDPVTTLIFLRCFGLVGAKNCNFLEDVLFGNVSRVKGFLGIKRNRKEETAIRIAVILSCSFNQAKVLDLLLKNVHRNFIAKFEHIFLPLAYGGNADADFSSFLTSGFRKVFEVILKWSQNKNLINLNNSLKDDFSTFSFKPLLFLFPKVEMINRLLRTGIITMEPGEWVEQFDLITCKELNEDIFKMFPDHDYFLQKLRSDLDDSTRKKFYDDDKMDHKVGEDLDNNGSELVAKVKDKDLSYNTNPCMNMPEEDTVPETMHSKYNIRSEISDEDFGEIMLLFDQIVGVTIRDMLKKKLIDKLLQML